MSASRQPCVHDFTSRSGLVRELAPLPAEILFHIWNRTSHVKARAVGRIRIMTRILESPLEAAIQKAGSLIVITGSMFSGKTEELIRRVRRALYARRSVQVFKHAIDTRSGRTEIRSHNGVPHEATAVATSEELLEKVDETTDVVAIEEAQFFDEGIVEACRDLADAGYEVVTTGLDMDFRGEPFGPMPRLLAEADEVVKLRAICARCGRDASRSQRLINGRPAPVSAPTILVAAEESYEARCRHCHEVPEGVFQYGLPGL
jgi:thymidine kinase